MTLEQRMKLYYEMPYKAYLTRRTPVVVRVDGKAAHTYTKALNKPFDRKFAAQAPCFSYGVSGAVAGFH